MGCCESSLDVRSMTFDVRFKSYLIGWHQALQPKTYIVDFSLYYFQQQMLIFPTKIAVG
jgi:hypothetical protein